ncbi:MAG: O-antigen ligase family protein [Deltaproteobacteria bacterium]|nr:O-antigen ligase family protein [Deltaproteobacteria bacterium]
MGLFIFLNPFPYTTAIKEVCFYGSAVLVLLLACFRKVDFSFRSPLTIPFVLFTLWTFVGLFFALDKENSIHDFQTHLIKYLAFYYILINYFNSRERLNGLFWVMIVSAFIFSIGEFVYFYVWSGNPLSTKLVTGLPEVAVNWIGIVLIPAILLSLNNLIAGNPRSVKIVSLICLIPALSLCFLTQARSTVLALVLSIVILCMKNKRILLACLGIVMVLTAVSIKDRFTKTDESAALRLSTHYITYEMIKDYPIMGIGFGMETYGNGKYINLESYSKRIPEKYRGYILSDPHSMPFSIAVRTGLIGLVLFLYILFRSFRMIWTCMKKDGDEYVSHWGRGLFAVLVSLLVIGLFEPFFSHVPEVIFYAVLAMMTIVGKLDRGRMIP